MTNLELAVDITIIILLLLTILYVWRLNRNLSILRQNQDSMFNLAQSLNEASTKANYAVTSLKSAAAETADSLQNVVEEAKNIKEDLLSLTANNTSISSRLPQSSASADKNYTFGTRPQTANIETKSEAEMELIKALRSIE